jgi:hypothetical protein
MQFLPAAARSKFPDPSKQPLNARQCEAAHQVAPRLLSFVAAKPLQLLANENAFVEVILHHEELLRAARNSKKRCLWGDGIYTADSDLFSVLIHQAYMPARCMELAFRWPTSMDHMRALLEVLPAQASYPGSCSNCIRSRSWPAPSFNCSYRVARAWLVIVPVCSPFLATALRELLTSMRQSSLRCSAFFLVMLGGQKWRVDAICTDAGQNPDCPWSYKHALQIDRSAHTMHSQLLVQRFG